MSFLYRSKRLTLKVRGGRYHRAVVTQEGTVLFLHFIVENRTPGAYRVEALDVFLGSCPVRPERPVVVTPLSYSVRGITCKAFDLDLLPELPLDLGSGTRAEMIYTGFATERPDEGDAEIALTLNFEGGEPFRSRFRVPVDRRDW